MNYLYKYFNYKGLIYANTIYPSNLRYNKLEKLLCYILVSREEFDFLQI